ncbi:MAG: hypothetical protein JW986_00735 [Methanotrichaceae archaeon]|nr:hypothetical protein [Methanotrichaceae archaeon]
MYRSILALIAILALASAGAAELSDYQRGVIDGLETGLQMGGLKGEASCNSQAATSFNSYVDAFNEGLLRIFGQNDTILAAFWLSPLSISSAATTQQSAAASGPVALGGGKAATNQVPSYLDGEQRINGYPASAYYTAVGGGTSSLGMSWV